MVDIQIVKMIDQKGISQCQKLFVKDSLENLVLIGDLYPPCLTLSDIYAIYSDGSLLSCFSVFLGFMYPSVVLPASLPLPMFSKVLKFLRQELSSSVTFVSFSPPLKKIEKYFTITTVSHELCMILSKETFTSNDINTESVIKADITNSNDVSRIKSFYTKNNAYPWHPNQLKSGFYHFIHNDAGQIIACGGTHFESPDLAHLGNIYVETEYRGRGYGKQLTCAILKEVFLRKTRASLFVVKTNTVAQALYQSLGFSLYKPVEILTLSPKA